MKITSVIMLIWLGVHSAYPAYGSINNRVLKVKNDDLKLKDSFFSTFNPF